MIISLAYLFSLPSSLPNSESNHFISLWFINPLLLPPSLYARVFSDKNVLWISTLVKYRVLPHFILSHIDVA